MMAVAGIFFQEIWHPLLAGADFETALDQYYGVTEFIPDFGLGALFVLSLFEFKSIAKGWDPIEETLKNPSKCLVCVVFDVCLRFLFVLGLDVSPGRSTCPCQCLCSFT
jgi:hypothetical protein